jgi:hypothetical protein
MRLSFRERFFGIGGGADPDADCYAVAIFSGQSFETLEGLILGPSDFVPKLTPSETGQVSDKPTTSPPNRDSPFPYQSLKEPKKN